MKLRLQPPSPSDFDGLLYPWVRWYPHFFFIKMTTKDVKEICPRSLSLAFWSDREKNLRGARGCNHPTPSLVRRGLMEIK